MLAFGESTCQNLAVLDLSGPKSLCTVNWPFRRKNGKTQRNTYRVIVHWARLTSCIHEYTFSLLKLLTMKNRVSEKLVNLSGQERLEARQQTKESHEFTQMQVMGGWC